MPWFFNQKINIIKEMAFVDVVSFFLFWGILGAFNAIYTK